MSAQLNYEQVVIKGKNAVRCPNPDCNPEGGCCLCEWSGWVYEYVLDEVDDVLELLVDDSEYWLNDDFHDF